MRDHDNDNPSMTHGPDGRDGSLPLSALLRLAADGELTDAQRARLDAHLASHPEDNSRIAFERALRARVAAVMSAGAAPDHLRAAVEDIARDAVEAQAAPDPMVRANAAWWRRRPTAVLALAAALLLAVSAHLATRSGTASAATPWLDREQGVTLVSFVEKEHARIAALSDDDNAKFTTRQCTETAQRAIKERLGVAPERIDIVGCGYEFVGVGPCHVPGGERSVHLMYRHKRPDKPPVSLFVQRDFTIAADNGDARGKDDECLHAGALSTLGEVRIWRDSGLIYYLVVPRGGDADETVAALGGPAKLRPL